MNSEKLIELLKSEPTEDLFQKALIWLGDNPEDDLLEDIFEIVVLDRLDQQLAEWALRWFEFEPKAKSQLLSQLIKRLPTQKQSVTLDEAVQSILINSEPNDDSIFLACRLIEDHSAKQLIPLTLVWLQQNEGSQMAGPLIRCLALADPSPESIDRALGWLNKHPSDWYGYVMLSSLLELRADEKLIDIGIEKLQDDPLANPELLLLVGPLINAGARSVAAVRARLANDFTNSSTGDLLIEAFRAAPRAFVDLVAVRLEHGPRNTHDVLSREARAWARSNSDHPISKKLLSS